MNPTTILSEPVIRDLADFDRASGSRVERALFNHRGLVVFLCLLITVAHCRDGFLSQIPSGPTHPMSPIAVVRTVALLAQTQGPFAA